MFLSLFYSSKVSRDTLYESVNGVLDFSKNKKRNFLETVELQIGLKNYDPQKDKRFSGTVKYVEDELIPVWPRQCITWHPISLKLFLVGKNLFRPCNVLFALVHRKSSGSPLGGPVLRVLKSNWVGIRWVSFRNPLSRPYFNVSHLNIQSIKLRYLFCTMERG